MTNTNIGQYSFSLSHSDDITTKSFSSKQLDERLRKIYDHDNEPLPYANLSLEPLERLTKLTKPEFNARTTDADRQTIAALTLQVINDLWHDSHQPPNSDTLLQRFNWATEAWEVHELHQYGDYTRNPLDTILYTDEEED